MANHPADLIQDAHGDNRVKELLMKLLFYESASPVSLVII